jgi:SnoaL-like domain
MPYDSNYANDRAEIEDLQARYMFALDWLDADAYASTFTEDGVLDWAFGVVEGRMAIHDEIATKLPALFAEAGYGASVKVRHLTSNLVLKIEGDRASARTYWSEVANDGLDQSMRVCGYGHYDDDLVRVKGRWLFKRRRINAVHIPGRGGPNQNPAW